MNARFLLPALLFFWLPLHGDPVAEKANPTAGEAEKPAGPIRLDGMWEIHVGGRNTGVELSIRQITERFHSTFSKPPANNPLGIGIGDNFLWGTLSGFGGEGNIFLVDEADEPGGPVKREQAPARFQVNQEIDRIRVEVDKEDLNPAMKRFEIVRIGRVESLRLYVNGPGELQAAPGVLEDQHMIVEVNHSNPDPSPVEVTLGSGANTLTLVARPVGPDEDEEPRPGILLTDPFVATFGDSLAVEAPRPFAEENTGREPTSEDWKLLTGTWRVLYYDSVLGDITGWVHFDPYGRCDLHYTDPADASLQTLALVKARIDGETPSVGEDGTGPALTVLPKFSFEFSGQGVRSEKIEKPALPEDRRLLLDPAQPGPVSLKASDFEADAEFIFRDLPDSRKVRLELEGALPGGSLMWNWSYRADRTTARDAEGFGRAGALVRADAEKESTVGLAMGREVWMRHGPRIVAAFCLDNQVAYEDREYYGKPVAEYRLAEIEDASSPYKLGISGNLHRKVFIVAEDLPPPRDGKPYPDLRIGEGSGVEEYRILARGAEEDFRNSPELKKAWVDYREVAGARKVGVIPEPEVIREIRDTRDRRKPRVVRERDGAGQPVEEGLLVLSIIRPRAEPGPQPFVLAESEGAWNLLYGDMRGKFMIARQLAESVAASGDLDGDDGEWETVSEAFTPEVLHLVVDLQNAREGIKEIKAVLALNDEVVKDGEDSGSSGAILLTPDPNQPTLYRSPPIHLVTAGRENLPGRSPGDIVLKVKNGDILKARVQGDSGYFLQPSTTTAKVFHSPDQLNALWKNAVKTAADLAGQPVEDWNDVLTGTADSVTNFIFTEFAVEVLADGGGILSALREVVAYAESHNVVIPQSKWLRGNPSGGIRSLEISIGDHAAMLLLRDEFIVMMNEQLADWGKNQSPPVMRSIYESQKSALANRRSPLSYVRIPIRSLPEYEEGPQSLLDRARLHVAENKTWWLAVDTLSPNLAGAIRSLAGDDVGRVEDPYLYQLFDPEFLGYKTRVKEDAAYFEQLQWSAFCHAFRQWGPMMRQTISEARSLGNGDVKGLIKLTGVGFETVVERLVPRMMKLETNAEERKSNWVPDRLARAHVKSLGVLGRAAKAQEEYSELDTTAMLAVAAVATMPLGGGGFWSAMVAASVSGADLAYTIYHDVIGNEARSKELEFEVGAGAVLGVDRAADTESKILGDLEQAFAVVGSGLGMGVDGVVFARSLRALKTANLVEEAGRLLRNVDFTDPAALRALSKQDQALLAEMIRRGDELAAKGRFGDIPDEFREVNANRKSILESLDGGGKFSDEAIELARRREETLAASEDQPKTLWRDNDFVEADKALENKILKNNEDIAALEKESKTIRDKYTPEEPPHPRGEDAARLSELEKRAKRLRNENGDFSQRRDVISSYRRPQVKVPARQAEILRGEGAPPSRSEFEGLRDTRERVRDGRAPASGEGLERVDLDAAAERIDDLTKATRENIDDLALRNPGAGTPDARALEEARARLDDLAEIRHDVADLAGNLRSDVRSELSAGDASLLRGERSSLNAADEARVVNAIVESEGDWSTLLKKAEGSPDDQFLMQKIHQWRRDKMDEALQESMREVESALGLPKGSIKPSAFGSTNLTSDYDISINPPVLTGPGRGPELAVRRFQEKTRNLFGGRESGAVVDTNVYTDPVYTIFKGSELQGDFGKLTAAQVDTSRQFLFQQMANAKYRTPGQWEKLRERVLEGVPPDARKALGDILDQAEGANHFADGRLHSTLKARGIDNPSAAQRLRANNDLYADTLETIDGYKQFIEGVKKAGSGEIPASRVDLPGFLRGPEMEKALGEGDRLLRSGDPELVAKGREILDDLSNRAILNMRNKQGEALYYAAEAYQTEATINHVVKEMQAPPKKLVTAESIMSGNHNLKPPKEPLSPDDYTNSYFENGANLVKELNAKKVLSETGGTIPGHAYNDKAATKASKYFIRQLDAASMARLDMNEVKIPGFPDDFTFKQLVESTIELEKNRANLSKFKDVLKKYNMSGEQYLERVLMAQESLDTALMGRSSLPGFVNDLRAAENSAEMAVSSYFRSGGKKIHDPSKLVRPGVTALGKELLKTREEYETGQGKRLAELDQARETGRFLTPEQNDELGRLRSVATAQEALEDAGGAARLSGIPPSTLDSLLANFSAEAGPAEARLDAANRIREATRDHLAANAPVMDPASPATLPEPLRESLGLDGNASSLDPGQMETLLVKNGNHASRYGGDTLDAIGSQLEADRRVLAKVANPNDSNGSGAAWVRVHHIADDRVIADDPVSGEPVTYSPDVFSALSGNLKSIVLSDPYRSPDGNYRDLPVTHEARLDLDAALPLPDGGVLP